LKKDNFNWNPQAEEAFVKLKTAMSEVSILAFPDFSKSFALELMQVIWELGLYLFKKVNY